MFEVVYASKALVPKHSFSLEQKEAELTFINKNRRFNTERMALVICCKLIDDEMRLLGNHFLSSFQVTSSSLYEGDAYVRMNTAMPLQKALGPINGIKHIVKKFSNVMATK